MQIDISNELAGYDYELGENKIEFTKNGINIEATVYFSATVKEEYQDGFLFHRWYEDKEYEIEANGFDSEDREVEVVWNENLLL